MSGNTSRARGRSRELDVLHYLQTMGFVVYRLSRGPADLVALKAGHPPRLFQVKSTLTPYQHFRADDRASLYHEAIVAGAEAVLAWWPKNGQLKFIESCEWPTTTAHAPRLGTVVA